MDEMSSQESIRKLNPSYDKLGKERDFRDAVIVRLNQLETRVRELELCFEDKRASRESEQEDHQF